MTKHDKMDKMTKEISMQFVDRCWEKALQRFEIWDRGQAWGAAGGSITNNDVVESVQFADSVEKLYNKFFSEK